MQFTDAPNVFLLYGMFQFAWRTIATNKSVLLRS